MPVPHARDRVTIRPAALLCSVAGLMLPAAALAQQATTDVPADIRVIGHRDPEGLLPDQTEPRAVSAISADFIGKQAPTLNAFQLVGLLPGANVASSDPYGLSTSSSLTLRGLGQDEIAVLLEGAPQNDIGYFYAYPSQFADPANVRQIALAQGSTDIDAPTVVGAGGLMALTLDDPRSTRQGSADLSLGSHGLRRVFVRADTGPIAGSAVKAFLSYSNTRADNWRGAGYDTRQHVDAKLLAEWGNGNRASLALSYNDANSSSYPSPTLAEWQAQGRGFNYDARYQAGATTYWRLYRAPFRNLYASAPVHLVLGDRWSFDGTSYLQFGYGNSPYGTQLSTTGNFLGVEELADPIALPGARDGVATVMGNYTGDQMRVGQVGTLRWQAGAHRIMAGLWFDYGTDRVTQTYTAVDAEGRPADRWGYRSKAIRTADGRLLAYENQRTVTVTKSAFLADSIALGERLTIDIGVKGVGLLRNGRNYLPGPQTRVRRDSFTVLPRAALRYAIDDRQQVFANITTNFRPPNEFTLYDSYDGGVVSTRGTAALKNEYSVSQELGYRYIGPSLSASITGFHYDFRNRQLATVVDNGGAQVNTTLNAGGQHSYGIDAEIDYRPARGVSVYVSGEYLRARLDDDLPVGDDTLPTRGKHAVSSPTLQIGGGGTYDDGRLFGSVAGKYVGRQYATFLNDESIPGYATVDLAIGVHLADWFGGKRTDLRLNAINVTDPHVLAGVQAVTANAREAVGRGGTIVPGQAPAYYIAGGAAVTATVSRSF
ncbi:iron complex outermembrane receptor protein [Sphingomonas abaci]|uniref:Iron complex outermembrane receptor protein n=2 Tax=Sphingomonas abaci TaxID=237611 RepID=A0A7W7AM69_9SPHN|nr:iron complex outermembrane receptor protein [Sphingomonas abaci]